MNSRIRKGGRNYALRWACWVLPGSLAMFWDCYHFGFSPVVHNIRQTVRVPAGLHKTSLSYAEVRDIFRTGLQERDSTTFSSQYIAFAYLWRLFGCKEDKPFKRASCMREYDYFVFRFRVPLPLNTCELRVEWISQSVILHLYLSPNKRLKAPLVFV